MNSGLNSSSNSGSASSQRNITAPRGSKQSHSLDPRTVYSKVGGASSPNTHFRHHESHINRSPVQSPLPNPGQFASEIPNANLSHSPAKHGARQSVFSSRHTSSLEWQKYIPPLGPNASFDVHNNLRRPKETPTSTTAIETGKNLSRTNRLATQNKAVIDQARRKSAEKLGQKDFNGLKIQGSTKSSGIMGRNTSDLKRRPSMMPVSSKNGHVAVSSHRRVHSNHDNFRALYTAPKGDGPREGMTQVRPAGMSIQSRSIQQSQGNPSRVGAQIIGNSYSIGGRNQQPYGRWTNMNERGQIQVNRGSQDIGVNRNIPPRNGSANVPGGLSASGNSRILPFGSRSIPSGRAPPTSKSLPIDPNKSMTGDFVADTSISPESKSVGTSPKSDAKSVATSGHSRKPSGKHHHKPKYCFKCNQPIIGTLVRAMGHMYHVNCFTCYDCGKPCSDKFFAEEIEIPVEGKSGTKKKIEVPLCEYDYFRRIHLICFNCNKAIRGSYITAVGRKYHPEHFYCEICHKVFQTEDYYEHDGKIYCHYHYSKLYSAHCEACKSAILKQYVEMHRGGSEQQWHPECFMIHKFWGVDVTLDCIGLNERTYRALISVETPEQLAKVDETVISPEILFESERKLEQMTMSIWLTLSEFEESCAACISDMLHAATVSNKHQGLLASGRLVLKIECLFKGIDVLNAYARGCHLQIDYESEKYRNMPHLMKEPRNMSSKLMSYLTFLRDSTQEKVSTSKYSRELLSLISMLAHYIKLISRNSLMHALEFNRLTQSTVATDKYLREISNHSSVPEDVLPLIKVTPRCKGQCSSCGKSIEGRCYKFDDLRWHPECLQCGKCGRHLGDKDSNRVDKGEDDGQGKNSSTRSSSPLLINEISYNRRLHTVLCEGCGAQDVNAVGGFTEVTRYDQLVYLLKIALVRSRHAMQKRGLIEGSVNSPSLPISPLLRSNDRYSRQVSDITRMRSQRQNRKVGTARNEIRKSIIVEAPEASIAGIGSDESDEETGDTEDDDSRVKEDLSMKENEADDTNDVGVWSPSLDQNRKTSDSSTSLQNMLAKHRGSRSLSMRSVSSLSGLHSPRFLHKSRSLGRRGSKRLRIQDIPMESESTDLNLDATSNLLKNEKGLTLDDIPRIVSSEQAREYRPNAFRFQKRTYESTTSNLPVPKPVRKRLSQQGKHRNVSKVDVEGPKDSDVKQATPDTENVPLPTEGVATTSSKLVNSKVTTHSTESIEKRPENGAFRAGTGATAATGATTSTGISSGSNTSGSIDSMQMRYSELTEKQHEYMRHISAFALHVLMGDQLSLDDCISFIDVHRSTSFWGKIFGGSRKNNYSNVHKIFGEPLEAVSAKYGVDSDLGVGPEKLRIPTLVDETINAMHTKDLSAEGVFRLNGNIRRLKKLIKQINANPNEVPDLYSENPIQLAALLKRFARELPDPLLTFKLYDLFILSQKYIEEPKKRIRILRLAYGMLPKVHRDLTEVLLAFLNWVATFCRIDEETGSKMDIHNLATVLTPNILYAKPKDTGKKPNSADLIPNGENHFLAIEVVNTLIEDHDELSIVPADLLALYKTAGLDKPDIKQMLTTKEIMAKCQAVFDRNPHILEIE